jgi:TrpR family trp operon transcriptional repressor
MNTTISHSQRKRFESELLELLMQESANKQQFKAVLIDLLSPKEYTELLIRWQIIKELSKGTPQREIAKKLGVSFSKITRGSHVFANPKSRFAQLLR